MALEYDPNRQNPDGTPYLETLSRNGATMRRCQAKGKRTGHQCPQAAVSGTWVCHMHGKGTKVRVARGEAKPAGGQLKSIYTEQGKEAIAKWRDHLLEQQVDLRDTSEEMLTLKAIQGFLLEQETTLQELMEVLKDTPNKLTTLLEGLTEPDILLLDRTARAIQAAHRAYSQVAGYVNLISDSAMRVHSARKMQAETEAKQAEAKAYEAFGGLVEALKPVVYDFIPPDQHEVFHQRLQNEVLAQYALRAAQRLPKA